MSQSHYRCYLVLLWHPCQSDSQRQSLMLSTWGPVTSAPLLLWRVSIAEGHLVLVESLPIRWPIDGLAWPHDKLFFFLFTDGVRYVSATQHGLEYCVFHLSIHQSIQRSMYSRYYGNWKGRKWLKWTTLLLVMFQHPTSAYCTNWWQVFRLTSGTPAWSTSGTWERGAPGRRLLVTRSSARQAVNV